MEQLIVVGLDAISYSLTIILVAIGLVVIFGLMNVINFAHGELFLLGAYTVVLTERAGGSFWVGLLLAPVVLALVGLVLEELVIRHVYHRFIDTILATWGLSVAIKQGVVVLFGPAAYQVSMPLPYLVSIAGSNYPAYRLFVMLVALGLVAVTFATFYRTRFGLAVRAVMVNRSMSGCLGINTRRLDRITFAVGAGMAGLAGAVMTPLMSVDPQMGLGFLVPSFLAILVGGAGSLAGALSGAAIVGGTNTVTATVWSPIVAQVLVFSLAIVIIWLCPRGLVAWRSRK